MSLLGGMGLFAVELSRSHCGMVELAITPQLDVADRCWAGCGVQLANSNDSALLQSWLD